MILNYLSQIIGFQLKRKLCPLTTSAIALYYVLLEDFNSAGFPDKMPICAAMLAAECGFSETTLRRARGELVACGLLNFKSGGRENYSVYALIPLSPREMLFRNRSKESSFSISEPVPELSETVCFEEYSAADAEDTCSSACSAAESAHSVPHSAAEPVGKPFAKPAAHLKRKGKELKPNPSSLARAGDSAETDPAIQQKRFREFWDLYPRKVSFLEAKRVYDQLSPTPELHRLIVSALKTQLLGVHHTENSPNSLPNPANWLRERKWESFDQRKAKAERSWSEFEYTAFSGSLSRKCVYDA